MFSSTSSRFRWTVCVALIAAGTVLFQPGVVSAQNSQRDGSLKSKPRFLAAFREVVAGPAHSTVRVWCKGNDKPVAFGAVVGADGWIVTKASQLKGAITCEVYDYPDDFPARIVGVSEPYDLAMLKIECKGLTPVTWRDSKDDAVGSWVATPGIDLDPVAVGVLSVATRKITGPELARRRHSGGFLGISVRENKDSRGVKVVEVIRGGAADKAGFEEDDVIIAIGKKTITDRDALLTALEKTKPGQRVTVVVRRGSEKVELRPKLGERPPERADIQNKLGSELSERRSGFPMVLQHDTVLRPVDCGGPLVDLDGKVIGINIARVGRTETLAIPAEAVKTLLDDLKSGKLAPPK